jgi:DNA-binding transcriptional ArsR family regulator
MIDCVATSILRETANFRKPRSCHGRIAPSASRFRAGCAATPEALLLSFIPVTFDLYSTVRRHLHWTLQNLVAYADRAGKCWPSVRTLAATTGQPRSTVSRHLAQLTEAGVVKRQRKPGGVYAYVIEACFLPARRGVSHQRERGVPPARTEEQQVKKTGYARARFAKSGISFGEIPDERSKWEARLRGWRKSRFWLPSFGPKPTEPGCFAPLEVLASGG